MFDIEFECKVFNNVIDAKKNSIIDYDNLKIHTSTNKMLFS
jgi:hypothetical protein